MAALIKPVVAEYPNKKLIQLTKGMFPVVPRPGDK
jgi:hypothetical protein